MEITYDQDIVEKGCHIFTSISSPSSLGIPW